MFTVENRIGRLVEIRLRMPIGVEELPSFVVACKREIGKALRRQPGRLSVILSDVRGCSIISPELFTAITALMKNNNAVCERSGQLTKSSAVGLMQADRAVRETGHTDRRNFNQPEHIIAYLAEVLTEKETARAEAFLAEFDDTDKK